MDTRTNVRWGFCGLKQKEKGIAMDIDFIALLDPKQKFLEFAESKVKDFLKTREDYQKFEQLFVEIGKTVCDFEADGSELRQKLLFAFSAVKMERLANVVHQSNARKWQKIVESHLNMY